MSKDTTAPLFPNRWIITGALLTQSPLHIGDGGNGSLHDRSKEPDASQPRPHTGEREPGVSTVCVDHRNRCYVPGSSIKGPLRALALHSSDRDAPERINGTWNKLFGYEGGRDATDSQGGALEFWDAYHLDGIDREQASAWRSDESSDADRLWPWWDGARRTCVAVHVSLDRPTRTVRENLLYHLEYVPAGERFQFEVTGDDLSWEEVGAFVALLRSFSPRFHDPNQVTLGGQKANGWGRVELQDLRLRILTPLEIEKWKKNPTCDDSCFRELSKDEIAKVETAAEALDASAPGKAPATLRIGLSIGVSSPWLIRDPRQSARVQAAKKHHERAIRRAGPEGRPADAVFVKDENGHAYIPEGYLRKMLRMRAEMILRTLGGNCAPHPSRIPSAAIRRNGREAPLDRVRAADLVARLFGMPGWRSTIEARGFRAETTKDFRQEFVAIDRFTGGAAEGLKFDAVLADATKVPGEIVVNLRRLEVVDPNLESLGLLALVLRDLAEGDLPIGAGTTHGQGECRVDVTIDGEKDWRDHRLLVDGLGALRENDPRGLRRCSSER